MNANRHIQSEIQWQDLRHFSIWQVAYNVILPYPFLALSWYFAYHNAYAWAVINAYFFYVTAFRQTHDSFHGSLGVGRKVANILQFVMSGLLLSSTHAMKASHLAHHREPLAEDDAEGSLARLTWWQAIFSGIAFRVNIREPYKKPPSNLVGFGNDRWHDSDNVWAIFKWDKFLVVSCGSDDAC